MLFEELAHVSVAVAATTSRSEKAALLAGVLRRLDTTEIAPAVAALCGTSTRGRLGVGWATLQASRVEPAADATLTITDVERRLGELEATTGAGSVASRRDLLADLFRRATEPEQRLLAGLLGGELRQGAIEGVMAEAIATAAGVPVAAVRRAAMLSGDLGHAGVVALGEGIGGLETIGLEVLRPVQPMLAATAAGVGEALSLTGPASVEWKLDGARVQVHRHGDDVRIFTRNLNEVTDRLGAVVDTARALPARSFVLDGEVLGLDSEGRPRAFQDTMSSFGDESGTAGASLHAAYFDILHLDGTDLLDTPLGERIERLAALVGGLKLPGQVTDDPEVAARVLDEALHHGHEGVVVKAIGSRYEAGRRGGTWRKVKPVRTLDLVVLAAEWGHGRRTGWLSNLHLGARAADGSFVMVGKTFKGMTDELLRWQTEAFLARVIARTDHVVHIRPELVVEIAVDGVQSSRRYPGGSPSASPGSRAIGPTRRSSTSIASRPSRPCSERIASRLAGCSSNVGTAMCSGSVAQCPRAPTASRSGGS